MIKKKVQRIQKMLTKPAEKVRSSRNFHRDVNTQSTHSPHCEPCLRPVGDLQAQPVENVVCFLLNKHTYTLHQKDTLDLNEERVPYTAGSHEAKGLLPSGVLKVRRRNGECVSETEKSREGIGVEK